jgi:phage-related protein
LKKIDTSNGIFEFKQRDEISFYRIFAFWDNYNDKKTLILGTHGLNKKTNKTPRAEIEKATRIKKLYFYNKRKK